MNKSKEMLVGIYDKVVENVYLKIVPMFFWKSEEIVRVDRISNEIILFIETTSFPEKVFINSVEYKLIKNENKSNTPTHKQSP